MVAFTEVWAIVEFSGSARGIITSAWVTSVKAKPFEEMSTVGLHMVTTSYWLLSA